MIVKQELFVGTLQTEILVVKITKIWKPHYLLNEFCQGAILNLPVKRIHERFMVVTEHQTLYTQLGFKKSKMKMTNNEMQ